MKIKFNIFRDWSVVIFEVAIAFPSKKRPCLSIWFSFLFWTFGVDFIFSKKEIIIG